MHDMLKSLLAKKKPDDKMDPMYKDAKMGVLKEIHKLASDSMANDLGNAKEMQSVTVAAPDQDGLVKGLSKAEDMMAKLDPSLKEGVEEAVEAPEMDMGIFDLLDPDAESDEEKMWLQKMRAKAQKMKSESSKKTQI